MNTDIYNPLALAAEAARDGDSSKTASYIESIAKIFFPVEGGDDPLWPNAANNTFKRAAYSLIDFYLDEEAEIRELAILNDVHPKVLANELDVLWGHVTLYNCFQLFVSLISQKRKNPYMEYTTELENLKAKVDGLLEQGNEADARNLEAEFKEKYDDDTIRNIKLIGKIYENAPNSEEMDLLTLYFEAVAMLPNNDVRGLVMDAHNTLKPMGDSEKMVASINGICVTGMAYFTDPKIATLTSGRPSQNVDLAGVSFPRRFGFKLDVRYVKRFILKARTAKWSAYEDSLFTKPLGKEFNHNDMVDANGWVRYYFDGIVEGEEMYVKCEIISEDGGIDRSLCFFYFKFIKGYQTSLDGKGYSTDPITGDKLPLDGILQELKYSREENEYLPAHTVFKSQRLRGNQTLDSNYRAHAITKTSVRYTEKPRMIFMVTPPHLTQYAKLLLILLKQLVDLNFEQSYITKENQKPLYKTSFMLDELGNLQSDGQGIQSFETMLSIGLGQGQEFTLILQTIQQLTAVYGDVDKVVQGNTSNIVFLKSTDDVMIEQLVKMSGTTHRFYADGVNLTMKETFLKFNRVENNQGIQFNSVEKPLISYNDFASLPMCNNIIIAAGESPIWSRNETGMPMAYELHKNQIKKPGKDYSFKNIPTLSTAMEFDLKQNKPDFKKMVDKRISQAILVEGAKRLYKEAMGYDDDDIDNLDRNVYATEIMSSINNKRRHSAALKLKKGKSADSVDTSITAGSVVDTKGVADVKEGLDRAAYGNKKRYARDSLSKYDLVDPMTGAPKHALDEVFILAFRECRNEFQRSSNAFKANSITFKVNDSGLYADDGTAYITLDDSALKASAINVGAVDDPEASLYAESKQDVLNTMKTTSYTVSDAFYQFLVGLDAWAFIEGSFDREVAAAIAKISKEM